MVLAASISAAVPWAEIGLVFLGLVSAIGGVGGATAFVRRGAGKEVIEQLETSNRDLRERANLQDKDISRLTALNAALTSQVDTLRGLVLQVKSVEALSTAISELARAEKSRYEKLSEQLDTRMGELIGAVRGDPPGAQPRRSRSPRSG